MRLNPRPTKSLCDLVRTIQKSEAEELLIKGIQQGMYSALDGNGIPKFIWSVSELGEVFEAKTDTHGSGHYHGYPLEDEDTMKLYVISVWKQ